MDKGRTPTNGLKDKEMNEYAQDLTFEKRHKLHVQWKEGEIRLVSI